MANMTTRGDITPEVNAFYDKLLLATATPRLVHTRFAQVRNLPAKAGTNTIKFRRYNALAPVTTPLTEGVTPAGSKLGADTITSQIRHYGDYVTVTDVLNTESPDSELTIAARVLGEQSGLSFDHLARAALNAGTNVIYAGGRVNRSSVQAGDVVTLGNIQMAEKVLKDGKARTITSMVNPSTGFNTDPVAPAYIGILHHDIGFTVRNLPGFVPVERYGSQADVMDGEIGKVGVIRFIESTEAQKWESAGAGGTDVYSIVILGADAYGVSHISGYALRNIVKLQSGASDPLDQRQTSGWKGTFTAKILDENSVVRIECASEV